jgi:stage III sporulation protein AF
MIDALRNWIINICTIVIFITAIEMLLPNNTLKKYGKFVLGLILVVVIITPILNLFSGNFNPNAYIRNAQEYIDSEEYKVDYEKYRNENIKETLKNFKSNLELQCSNELKEEYPDDDFNVAVYVTYDVESSEFNIEEIDIWVKEGGISRIKPVNINSKTVSSNSDNQIKDRKAKEIKNYVSDKIQVSKNIINIYKMN